MCSSSRCGSGCSMCVRGMNCGVNCAHHSVANTSEENTSKHSMMCAFLARKYLVFEHRLGASARAESVLCLPCPLPPESGMPAGMPAAMPAGVSTYVAPGMPSMRPSMPYAISSMSVHMPPLVKQLYKVPIKPIAGPQAYYSRAKAIHTDSWEGLVHESFGIPCKDERWVHGYMRECCIVAKCSAALMQLSRHHPFSNGTGVAPPTRQRLTGPIHGPLKKLAGGTAVALLAMQGRPSVAGSCSDLNLCVHNLPPTQSS